MTGFVTKKISQDPSAFSLRSKSNRTKTLGSILKCARTKAGISLEEAESQTKIRFKYLEALEHGQYQQLPAEAYNIGFVRVYAEHLKLNPEKIIRMYREERSEKRHLADSINFAPSKVSDWHFLITPKVLGITAAVVMFGGVISYIAMQLNSFTRVPDITLGSIPSEFTSDKDKVQLAGVTTEGSVIMMNNEPVMVTPDGRFDQEIQLSPGVNEVVIAAKSRAGKQNQKSVKILFNPNLAKAGSSL